MKVDLSPENMKKGCRTMTTKRAMKAGNGQTQDNRSPNQSMMKNWVADASQW